MTAIELVVKLKNALEAHGFGAFETPYGKSYKDEQAWQLSISKDNKAYYEKAAFGGYYLHGLTIIIEVVHRHNGTDENKSVDVGIFKWKDSSGGCITKQRFNVEMSEKQIENRVNKIVASWDEIQ